jgi:hypothetical protein
MSEMMFAGARLKIDRAREHIKCLRAIQLGLVNGHTIRVYPKTNTGNDAIEIVPIEVEPYVMCVVGDAIHNLRSALDLAISDIEFTATGKRSHNITFPVRKTRDQVETAVKKRLEGKAPKRVLDYIVDSIQPYEKGNGDAIWQLHRLDLVDKHQLIVPHLQFDWIRNIRYIDDTSRESSIAEWVITRARRMIYPAEGRGVQITHKGNSSVSILFGDGMPFESKHISQTLSRLATFVTRTLLVLEWEFVKSQTP